MTEWLEGFLVRYPELSLYLVIALGYSIGALRFGAFSLGPVTGALFAGILVGQFAHVPVSATAKSFLFLLFVFGIGYSVGPQFMIAMRRGGLRPVLLALVVCICGLLTALVVSRILGLDPGFAAGLLSGALSQSPAMGTATEAVNALPLPEAERAAMVAHIAVADAICYVFGAAGLIIFCSTAAPRILGIDLKAEARKLEDELGMHRAETGTMSAWHPFELRAYRVAEDGAVAGRSAGEMEVLLAPHRFFLQRVRRGTALIEYDPSFVLMAGDVVAVSGRRELLIAILGGRTVEIEDRELLDIPVSLVDVFLTSREVAGLTLQALAGLDWTRGLHLRGISRGGQEIPAAPNLVLERGDVLRLSGPDTLIKQVAPRLGTIVAPTTATDFVVLGFAIFLGGLVGVLLSFTVAGMRISLSTSVGTLLSGLFVGHLRTLYPFFGRIPDGAVSLMTSLGLVAFVAMTGLHAGPVFFTAVAEAGFGLLLGGMLVTIIPPTVGLLFGIHVLRMNPVLALGAVAGSQTMTAAMAAVQERSGSPVAVLGYTPAYPIGNILLTTWGTVIVGLMAR